MHNRCRKILTVAEKMLQKITEKYVWNDKSWLEQYEPDNASRGNDRKSKNRGVNPKQGTKA